MDQYKRSFKNKPAVMKADYCGCYYCCSVFEPSEIEEWVDNNLTPICPHCSIDSILPYEEKIDGSMDNFKKQLKKWNKSSFS